MTSPRIITYVSDDPDCPRDLRAVAHCFSQAGGRFQLLPATQVGPDASECAERLAAFLETEIARERRRAENATAMGERIRAYWATHRGTAGETS
jgi:hypothetical protein